MSVFCAPKLKVSASALLLPAVIYFLDAEYLLMLVLAAVFVHECGHYAALRLCGGELQGMSLWLGGVSMQYGGLGYTGEIITALAGPFSSFALAVAASFAASFFGIAAAYHLSGLSLLLALFNLLPVFPLDGGRALFGVTALSIGIDAAERVRRVVDTAIMVLLASGGGALVIFTGNPTLLTAALWLIISGIKTR